MMRNRLAIRPGTEVGELRRHARVDADGRVAARLLAIANAISGMSRQGAAEAAGVDRQRLRDWVHRFNPDGIAGSPIVRDPDGAHGAARTNRRS